MTTTWTSRRAFHEILPGLPKMQGAVLNLLLRHWETRHTEPTAGELEEWSIGRGCWKRLSELRKAGLIHEGPTRKCNVTGKMAKTWRLGPKPEQGELF